MELVHITYLKMSKWNSDSSISKVNDYGLDDCVSIPDGDRIFLSITHEAHIDSHQMGVTDSLSKGEAA